VPRSATRWIACAKSGDGSMCRRISRLSGCTPQAIQLTPHSGFAFAGRSPGSLITTVKRPSARACTCSSYTQSTTRWLANSFSHSDQ
jgi:hypothetical protein